MNYGFVGACIIALLAPASVHAEDLQNDQFRLLYSVHVDGSEPTNVWIPIAHDTEFQRVEAHLPEDVTTRIGDHGNQFGFVKRNAPVDFVVAYQIKRGEAKSHRNNDDPVAHWLQPDKLIPTDDAARKLADDITKTLPADASSTAKARAIFDHVVSSMTYDKSGEGWGRGDFHYACAAKKGNCTDFHSLFIGLCRAAGIPARFIMGVSVPEGQSGSVQGYHCWAEFFDRDSGWVPVDASFALTKKQPDYYFGNLDPHRVAFTIGRDLVLQPAQEADLLNYMIFAYAERNGKPVPTKTTITYSRKKD